VKLQKVFFDEPLESILKISVFGDAKYHKGRFLGLSG